MYKKHCEGIIIETFNYKEFDKIITVFTKEFGIIKILVTNANKIKKRSLSNTSPLSRSEFILERRYGELWLCHDISLLESNIKLRNSLEILESAITIISTIKKTQRAEKPSIKLYNLTATFLHNLPKSSNPKNLSSSFLLKLLKYEGITNIKEKCCKCNQNDDFFYFINGENYCMKHNIENALKINRTTLLSLLCLQNSRSIQQIETLPIDKISHEIIKTIFNNTIKEHLI